MKCVILLFTHKQDEILDKMNGKSTSPLLPKTRNVKVVCFWSKLQGVILYWEEGVSVRGGRGPNLFCPRFWHLLFFWWCLEQIALKFKLQIVSCWYLNLKIILNEICKGYVKKKLYVACCLWRSLRCHVKPDISISQGGQKARFLDDSCRLISLIVRKKLEIW